MSDLSYERKVAIVGLAMVTVGGAIGGAVLDGWKGAGIAFGTELVLFGFVLVWCAIGEAIR